MSNQTMPPDVLAGAVSGHVKDRLTIIGQSGGMNALKRRSGQPRRKNMDSYEYKTKKHGTLRFTWSSNPSPYLWVSVNGGERWQCCRGGGCLGSTIMLGSDYGRNVIRCRKWARKYVRNQAEYAPAISYVPEETIIRLLTR